MRRTIRGKMALGMTVAMLAAMLGGCGGRQKEVESIPAQTDKNDEQAESISGGSGNADKEKTAGVGLEAAGQQTNMSSDVAMGRYVEEKIALPEELGFLYDGRVLDDGTVRLLGYINGGSDLVAFDSKDNGSTWERALSVNESMGTENSYAMCAAIAPDGGLFCQLFMEADGDYVNRNVKIAADGSWTDVDLQTEGDMASSIKYKENGKVLAHMAGDNMVCLYDDTTGECLRTYNETGGYVNYFGLAGDTVVVMGDSEAMLFDYETAESVGEEALSDMLKSDKDNFALGVSNAYPVLFCGGNADGEMYFCNKHKGICRYSAGGAVVEQIADANLNSLAKPSLGLEAMEILADGSFLVFAREGQEAQVLRYTYDADVPATPDTELKVYALHQDDALQQIISDFQTRNPDYYVSLEIGMTGEDAVTASDALRTLNTEMVAGNGPDVLILDGMPVDAYIERGILADISDVVENVKAADGVWETIADTYEKDGELAAVPSRFKVPVLVGEPDVLTKITDLQSLAATAEQLRQEDGETLQIMEFPSIYWGLRTLYRAYSPYLTAEDGGLNAEQLQEFVACAKQLFDLNHYDEIPEEQKAMIFTTTLSESDYSYDYSTLPPTAEIAMAMARMGACNLPGSTVLQTLAVFSERLGLDYAPLRLSVGNVYLPESIVGVSSQSSQIDGAKEFVTYLLSQDAQSVNSGSGFPINRAAFDAELNAPGAYSSSISYKQEDGTVSEIEYDLETLTQEDQERFRSLVEQLDTPALTDAVVEEMVLTQAGECLAGNLSADDAINAINQKMNLYLAE